MVVVVLSGVLAAIGKDLKKTSACGREGRMDARAFVIKLYEEASILNYRAKRAVSEFFKSARYKGDEGEKDGARIGPAVRPYS